MQIHLELPLDPPHGGEDLAAHMAFQRGWTLEHYATARRRRGVLYMITLGVPEGGSAEQAEEFEAEITGALQVMRGMPWLGVREVLAYLQAEKQLRLMNDEQAAAMFALLRNTDPAGWGDILRSLTEHVRPYAHEAGKKVAGLGAVSAVKALAALFGVHLP